MPIPLYSIHDLFISKGNEDKLTIKQFDIHRGACYVFEGRMGSGKTTFSGKLALHLKSKKNKRPLLVACDVYRPAAIDQIGVLAEQVGVDILQDRENKNPCD